MKMNNMIDEILSAYDKALTILDDYDHERTVAPKGTVGTYRLTYEECAVVIERMRFYSDSDLFGREKDDSFRGSIGNVYQTFGGSELYPTVEQKAATLLYLLVKNHSFLDGNKRIAGALFIYFLARCGILYRESGEACISNEALASLTLMIALSRPEDKEAMISIAARCICRGEPLQ